MKPIKEFSNYIAHEDGTIFNSVTRNKIKHTTNHNGYSVITLRQNGVKKQFRVNRVIAECFIPNPENKPQVNHKNGIKSDNSVENLEWATAKENSIHAVKTGLSKVSERNIEISSKIVIDTSTGVFYNSAKEAAEMTGIKYGTIVGYLNGSYKNKTSLIYA